MSKFKPQNVNMNDINKFVKSGAFDRQMKQHMPAIMEKVKKLISSLKARLQCRKQKCLLLLIRWQ